MCSALPNAIINIEAEDMVPDLEAKDTRVKNNLKRMQGRI